MARFKIEGEIIRWHGKNVKRTRTIDAETELLAREEFKKQILFTDHAIPVINYVTPLREKDATKTSDKLDALPPEIKNRVSALLRQHHIGKFSFQHAKEICLSEDVTYFVFHPKTGWNTVCMGGEWGGYKTGAAGAIGKTISIPVGSFVIEDQIFLGKYFIRVYHNNGVEAISA